MVSQLDDGTVEFAYFRPGASSVSLAADFADWRPDRHHLMRGLDGWWRLQLTLPPGEYRFKYVIDGTMWEADFAAYGVEMCKVGGWNSVLYIAKPQRRAAAKLQLAA